MKPGRLGNAALTATVNTSAITTAHAGHSGETLRAIPVETLHRSPWQPRTAVVRDEDFAALVASVEAHGVLQPVVVRELADGTLQLLAGERRLEAAKAAGHTTVPGRVRRGLTDAQARAIAITENLARKDLSAWEESTALRQLRDARAEAGEPTDVRALGAAAGRSKSLVADLLVIADHLTPEVFTAAERMHGAPVVHDVDTLPKATLLTAARGETAEERAALLVRAFPPRSVVTDGVVHDVDTGTDTPRARPRFHVTGHPDRRMAVRLSCPVADLSREDADTLLAELKPLVAALRKRAKDSPE